MKVAVVTGAARGIGRATVERLAAADWRVVAVDRCADDPGVRYPLATRAELAELAEAWPGVLDVVGHLRQAKAPQTLFAAARLLQPGEGIRITIGSPEANRRALDALAAVREGARR